MLAPPVWGGVQRQACAARGRRRIAEASVSRTRCCFHPRHPRGEIEAADAMDGVVRPRRASPTTSDTCRPCLLLIPELRQSSDRARPSGTPDALPRGAVGPRPAQFDPLCVKRRRSPNSTRRATCTPDRYVDGLEAARPDAGVVYLDGGDTVMEPSTWEVVLRGVGGTVQAVDKVLNGDVQKRVVACRPPGHHGRN